MLELFVIKIFIVKDFIVVSIVNFLFVLYQEMEIKTIVKNTIFCGRKHEDCGVFHYKKSRIS